MPMPPSNTKSGINAFLIRLIKQTPCLKQTLPDSVKYLSPKFRGAQVYQRPLSHASLGHPFYAIR